MSAVEKTLGIVPTIDILINNAGISGPNAKLWEYAVDDWKRIFAVNVEGTFYCCRVVVPLMRERNYGRIVNIASVAGKDGNPNASAYSASKAAIIALTKSLGKELADTSVRVNCVTPAAVRTPLFSQMTQAHIDYMLSKIPLGRLGEPQEIAALVAWLASEECSFSTAAVFDLSGGRSTYLTAELVRIVSNQRQCNRRLRSASRRAGWVVPAPPPFSITRHSANRRPTNRCYFSSSICILAFNVSSCQAAPSFPIWCLKSLSISPFTTR